MQRKIKLVTCATMLLSASLLVNAADLTKAYEMPDASKIIKDDLLIEPTVYTMPQECVSSNAESIARGEYIFHNLNSDEAKENPPAGLANFIETKDKDGKVQKKTKQYGNCVACHNIEGAKGGGNIGPDLTGYKAIFMDTKVRNNQFVYQKIADPRIDNANTHMTVNLATKLFNEQEICDLTSYVVSAKK